MAGGDAGRARTGIEIERDDDVWSRRNHCRAGETFAANSRATGPQWRLYRFHLLDLPAGEHGSKNETEDERVGIFANAGAGPDFFGQHREYPELVGDAGAGDW